MHLWLLLPMHVIIILQVCLLIGYVFEVDVCGIREHHLRLLLLRLVLLNLPLLILQLLLSLFPQLFLLLPFQLLLFLLVHHFLCLFDLHSTQLFFLLIKIPLSLHLQVSLSFDLFLFSASLLLVDGNFSLETFLSVAFKFLQLFKPFIGLQELLAAGVSI